MGLESHMRVSAGRGMSRADVRKLMLAAGWPSEVVSKYLDKTFKDIDSGTIIRVNGLTKRFGSKHVLEHIDFDIRSGEIFGIIGSSGAGKTTLLNLLVGFYSPDAGDVQLSLPNSSIISVFKEPQAVKRHVGFSTQMPSFYGRLTVRENLEHFASLYGLQGQLGKRRSSALMELVGLSDARDVIADHLSGGMQKRLDIACALIHDPDVLILDEPTADLDPVMRRQLWELINQVNRKGTTIILASHFLDEIELLCSRIAIIHGGRAAEVGTTAELRDIYSHNYELYFRSRSGKYDELMRSLSSKKKFIVKMSIDDNELVVETASPEQVLPVLSERLASGEDGIESLQISKPSLGKVFESVVKK